MDKTIFRNCRTSDLMFIAKIAEQVARQFVLSEAAKSSQFFSVNYDYDLPHTCFCVTLSFEYKGEVANIRHSFPNMHEELFEAYINHFAKGIQTAQKQADAKESDRHE